MRTVSVCAFSLAFLTLAARPATAQLELVAWGDNRRGQCDVPALPSGLSYVEVAAGYDHTVARRSDGSVVAWGYNNHGQCNVRALPNGLSYVEVAAGGLHTVARRSDGSVVAWGSNFYGQFDVPALPSGLSYVEVAAGYDHTVARRSDGSVVAWGYNGHGQCNVPALPSGLSYVEVAAGRDHTAARRSDGSVVAWGYNGSGQCNVPALPSGLSYFEVAAGGYQTVARCSDGSVVAWGGNWAGQCNVPALPSGLTYVEVAAGVAHTVARRGDGSVVAWGYNNYGQCNVPVLPTGCAYVALAAGNAHTVARVVDFRCYADWDGDGYGTGPAVSIGIPCGPGLAPNDIDCDDGDATVYPAAPELCDGLDNDCDGAVDDGLVFDYHADTDGDGFGNALAPLWTCAPPPGYVLDASDCDDGDPSVHPGATEICNGVDDDCDGSVDESVASTYCTSAITLNLCQPAISGTGTPSASATSGFTILVNDVDGMRPGLIVYGIDNSGFTPNVWGTFGSYLCVRSPHQRTPVQRAGGTFGGCDGVLSLDWNAYIASHPFALGNPFAGGETVWAQAWIRDPRTSMTSYLSDGLQFTVCP